MLLARFPRASLFLSTLLLVVASSPLPAASQATPELRQLTAATFEESIKHDNWFVEYFSPWCGHCKAFKPTWEQLVASREDFPRLGLAQVNCVEDGDLCNAQSVQYYPQLRLYRNHPNGTQTSETFGASRSLDIMEKWLDERVPRLTLPVPVQDHPIPDQQAGIAPKAKYNQEGRVLVLGTADFQETVAKEPTIVKFYAPWCGHCQKLAPKWIELASELKDVVNVAEVNCDAHGSVCRNADIEGYPTVVFYLNGRKIDYTGRKSVPAMAGWIRKAVAPGVTAVDEDAFSDKIDDHEVVFLLLHSGSDSRVVDIVSAASQVLLGEPPIYASTARSLYTQYGLPSPSTSTVPVLLAIKSHSSRTYTAKLELDGMATGHGSAEGLEKWLQRNRFPVVGKLGMDNFYSVMKNPTRPLVVLAALDPGSSSHESEDTPSAEDDEEGAPPEDRVAGHHKTELSASALANLRRLEEISTAWAKAGSSKGKERETVFVWMDGRKWGKWLKNMYGVKDVGRVGAEAGVVIVDHQSLLYYDTDAYGQPLRLNKESIFSALKSVYAGKGTPKHSENIIERIARSANNKVLAIEGYVKSHVKTTIVGVVFFFALIFYVLRCIFDSDLPTPNDYYVVGLEKKGRGRLD